MSSNFLYLFFSFKNYLKIVLLFKSEKMPSDGKVIHGYTSVDESMITGESIPRRKEIDDICIGGTISKFIPDCMNIMHFHLMHLLFIFF